MAWFIQFYAKIPPDTPRLKRRDYQLGPAIQLDHSLPKENKACPQDRVDHEIKNFEKRHGVEDWRQIADRYDTFEIDYD